MKRILFVDDEPRLLEGLQRMLRPQRKQWDMCFAKGAEEALVVLAATPCDVIVTDMRMPGMDGGNLLNLVQEQFPEVVRIVLSGHVEMEAALRAAPVAHQFLSKPCDPNKLCEAIERACGCRTMLTDENARRVVGAVGKLPVLPATCASLLAALQDSEVSLADVGKIVEQDVGITAKILQLVNSAFFGLHHDISSARMAVNYLGLDVLKQLVLAFEIFRTFQPSPLGRFSLTEFEAHSRLAAQIAARLPAPPNITPTAVVAALLHDTGKLVLATRLPAQFELALRTSLERGLPLYAVEEELTGTGHAEVGAYLLALWGLPHSIVNAVYRHHRPAVTEPRAQPALDVLAVTHIADALAFELSEGLPGDAPPGCGLLNMDYVAALGMTGQLPVWRDLARQVFEEHA